MTGSTRLQVTMAVTMGLAACVLPLDVTVGEDDEKVVRGSGQVITRTWTVGDFDAVNVRGTGQVIITDTGEEALTVTGERNVLAQLVVEIHDGELRIGPRRGVTLAPQRDLIMRLDVDGLSRMKGSGAVDLDAALPWAETLFVGLSGVATAEVEGAVDVLDVRMSGASWFWGRDLTSREADVSTSGAAAVVVSADERLRATASGVSSIRYLGSPTLHLNVSGLASVGPY